ncbi:four-helix bundle copper-binding protein [Halomarina oriensis]|uniref:Four-helix bundle copper-binding protein n=1 Tax=Halomarina oriensis TaxID=671145 RepID=A0A6B0GKU4_9EURY|nr:four-helix bundle copper-binding protein [Halomarina oriensis]MWG34357.1 four-helix bundle copper-binding protein [Halomarina oriensis]
MALDDIDHLNDDQKECLDNCLEATQACEWCADECAGHGEEMAECIRLCRDVADVASTHARFMARDSDYSGDLAAVCADACEACADECERHDHDHCQTCARVLRECAETCRAMA